MSNIKRLLRTAVQYYASDLYLSTGSQPMIRVNGDLFTVEDHAKLDPTTVSTYLKEILGTKISTDLNQSIDMDYSLNVEGIARFRVNVFAQHHGLSAIFRLIPENPMTIEQLHLPKQIKELATLKQGLVLVSGPTGCGKSTTLASIITEINRNQRKHIITIEDPIEFIHTNDQSIIEQREVGIHTKNFQTALRSALREDPDVILVGEMRDLETISLAITAAETGHLVLSTVHTQGAANSIDRIIDVFPPNQQAQIRTQLAATLKAVIWQQLLPTKKEILPGVKRVGALEILMNNHALRNLIRKGNTHQIDSIIETNRKMGMQSMEHALEELLQKGLISQEKHDEFLPDRLEI
jgi:twitching motility protein PilT